MAGSDEKISINTYLREPRYVVAAGACFGEVTYKPGGICGPRVQQGWQLVAILSGDTIVEVDGKPCPIPSGYVRLMSPGQRECFYFSVDGRTNHLWIDFPKSAHDPVLRKMLAEAPALLPLSSPLEALMRAGLEVDVSTPKGKWAIEAMGRAAFSLFCAEAQGGRKASGPLHPSILKACQFMEKQVAQPLDVQGISRAAGLSYNHFSRLFSRQMGLTPMEHVWHLRVQKAALLLRSTGLAMSEISEKTGFQNPFHFSRRFRSAFGISPRTYRQEAWKKKPD